MVQLLEVRSGGGSVRVGTTGTIGTLMTRELESMNCRGQSRISSKRKPPIIPASISCGGTAKRLQLRRELNEMICSSSSRGRISNPNHKNLENIQKTRCNIQKNNHRVPMLRSHENIALKRTPNREKLDRKASYIAEIVDIKCGNQNRWSSPIANRLKKLGFSKLSESVG